MSDAPEWRDWPEWQAVQTATAALIDRIQAEDAKEKVMVSDLIVVASVMPVEGELGSYHVYAQSKAPHVTEGLLRQGIRYVDACSPYGWEE